MVSQTMIVLYVYFIYVLSPFSCSILLADGQVGALRNEDMKNNFKP